MNRWLMKNIGWCTHWSLPSGKLVNLTISCDFECPFKKSIFLLKDDSDLDYQGGIRFDAKNVAKKLLLSRAKKPLKYLEIRS